MGPQSHVRSLTHSHFAYTICKISLLSFLRILFVASRHLVGWMDGSLCSCLSPQCQHVDMWDVTSDSEVAWWELFSVLLHKIGTVTGGLHEFPIDSGFFNNKRQYQHYCKVRKKLWFQPELAIHREREKELLDVLHSYQKGEIEKYTGPNFYLYFLLFLINGYSGTTDSNLSDVGINSYSSRSCTRFGLEAWIS